MTVFVSISQFPFSLSIHHHHHHHLSINPFFFKQPFFFLWCYFVWDLTSMQFFFISLLFLLSIVQLSPLCLLLIIHNISPLYQPLLALVLFIPSFSSFSAYLYHFNSASYIICINFFLSLYLSQCPSIFVNWVIYQIFIHFIFLLDLIPI